MYWAVIEIHLLAMINAESESITVGNNRLIATFTGRLTVCLVSGAWLDINGPNEFKDAITSENVFPL